MLHAVRVAYRMLAFATAIAAMPGSAWAQGGPGVSISYTLVKSDLTVGEPVFLKFSVENRLTEDVVVDDRVNFNGYGGFRVRIERPDGRTEDAPKPSANEVVLGRARSVAPSESFSTLLLVNKWVDFDVEGRYVLELEMTQPLVTVSGVKLPYPTDGYVIIDVGPRDPARLEEICAGLWSKLTNDPFAVGSLELKETLAYIKDPIAVPYLARIPVTDKGLEGWVIRALKRIADGPAVDALIAHVNSPSEDARVLVRGALRAIEKSTTDLVIKQKISASLQ